jgi:hypothetical protein
MNFFTCKLFTSTTTIKYRNFKMINLIHMISILNYVFTIVFYAAM